MLRDSTDYKKEVDRLLRDTRVVAMDARIAALKAAGNELETELEGALEFLPGVERTKITIAKIANWREVSRG